MSKYIVLEINGDVQIDGRIFRVDDELDCIDKGIGDNDGFDKINEIIGVANKIDLHKVIDISSWDILVVEWQVAKVESEITIVWNISFRITDNVNIKNTNKLILVLIIECKKDIIVFLYLFDLFEGLLIIAMSYNSF